MQCDKQTSDSEEFFFSMWPPTKFTPFSFISEKQRDDSAYHRESRGTKVRHANDTKLSADQSVAAFYRDTEKEMEAAAFDETNQPNE